MQISVWSNMHGQAAVSATTAALASTIAQKTNLKTLITHNHIGESALESYLFKNTLFQNKPTQGINNQGIDALLRLMKNGRLKPDMVTDYTYSVLKNHRMDILHGTSKKEAMSAEDYELILKIKDCAKKFYNIILEDAHSELAQNNCLNLLEKSDVIIFCINQNILLLNNLMLLFKKYSFLKEKKSAFIVSRYERNASLTLANIARRFNLSKGSIFHIPSSSQFADSLNTGRVFEYIAFNQNAKQYEDKAITQSFNKLCNYVVEGCRLNCSN